MNDKEIEDALIHEIALVLDADPAALSPHQPLDELGLDSMGFVEVLVFIEETFGLKLVRSGLETDDFRTVAALARRIARERPVPS